jgi:hypothetical protein
MNQNSQLYYAIVQPSWECLTNNDKQNMLHNNKQRKLISIFFLSFILSTTSTAPNASVLFAVWIIFYLLSAGTSWSSWKSLELWDIA